MTRMSVFVWAVAVAVLGTSLACGSSPVSDSVPPVDVPPVDIPPIDIPPVDQPPVPISYNLAGRWCGGIQGGPNMIWTASQAGQAATGPVQFIDGSLQFSGSLQANLANSASVPWTMNFTFPPGGSQCQVACAGSAPQTSDTQVNVTMGACQQTSCSGVSLPPTTVVSLTRNATCN